MNIIFLLIDGLRYDQIYGDLKESFTPNIDSLIQKGTFFKNSYASADGTVLSLNTIFNSFFPCKINNRARKIILEKNNLFNILEKENYKIFGLVPKIKIYDSMIKFFKNDEKTYEYFEKTESLSSGLSDKIINILKSTKSAESNFFYFHLSDLHPLREGNIPKGIEEFSDDKFGKSNYAKTVSSIDLYLKKVFSNIDFSNTVLIINSDHGERIPYGNITNNDFEPNFHSAKKIGKKILPKKSLKLGGKVLSKISQSIGENRIKNIPEDITNYQKRSRDPYFTLSLFDELLHVPLLFVGKDIPTMKISELSRHVDMLPTILEMVGIKYNKKIVDGKSLWPFEGIRQSNNLYTYLHTMPYEKPHFTDSVGIRTQKYKYFRSDKNKRKNVNLYDLESDPFENNNIGKDNPKLVQKFEKIIQEMEDEQIFNNENKLTPEEEAMVSEELRKMGYM